ncbi:hypothetical protein Anapl_01464 [Anas platyrhynchos]|uniref:Uncharacterized protein n=1 Tax=Anas platyrhynchos TaxID=8839 RepID=R0KD63_ANAPL|nr:hypothetical protein Anapl_01464 [Anas platyrhynchos]
MALTKEPFSVGFIRTKLPNTHKGYCTNQAATGNEIPAVGGLCAPCLQLQVSVWLKDFDCNTKWRPEV